MLVIIQFNKLVVLHPTKSFLLPIILTFHPKNQDFVIYHFFKIKNLKITNFFLNFIKKKVMLFPNFRDQIDYKLIIHFEEHALGFPKRYSL